MEVDRLTVAFARKAYLGVFVLLIVSWWAARFHGVGPGPPQGRQAVDSLLLVPALTSAFLGVFILHLHLPRKSAELALVLAAGTALELGLASWRYRLYGGLAALVSVGVGLGCAAMVAMLVRLIRGDPEQVRLRTYLWLAPLLPCALLSGTFLQVLAMEAHPQVYDVYVYLIECGPGFSPSFAIASFVNAWGLAGICYAVYHHLSALILWALCLSLKSRQVYFDVLAGLFLSGLLASALYNVYPMVGIGLLWGTKYPGLGHDLPLYFSPPPADPPFLVTGPAGVPRNAMPSMHTTWILMVFLVFWRDHSRLLRVVGWSALVLTLLSTFSVGCHYLIDLSVAFPFCAGCVAICARGISERTRVAVAAAGFGLTGLWLWALSTQWRLLADHGALTLLAELLTVGGAVLLERHLYRSSQPPGS